jgi:hypothetical protein
MAIEDIHHLLRKFGALSDALDHDLTAVERGHADRLAHPTTLDEIRAELQLHEDALAIAAERHRDLDARRHRALALRDLEELDRLEAVRAELDSEVPLLRQALEALRRQLDAFPTATG